jgi:dihydroorotate dehydrogenase (fumarate)
MGTEGSAAASPAALACTLGGMTLAGCVMNASGCRCTTEDELDELAGADTCAVVTKSATWLPRKGHLLPRVAFFGASLCGMRGTINSTGLANLGHRFYCEYARRRALGPRWRGKPTILSLAPSTPQELAAMLRHILVEPRDPLPDGLAELKAAGAHAQEQTSSDARPTCRMPTCWMVEVNLSCPNVGDQDHANLFLSSDAILLREFLDEIRLSTLVSRADGRRALVVGIKMPALFYPRDWDRAAKALLPYSDVVRFVTCINSVPNGLALEFPPDASAARTLIHPREGLGGVGGAPCKPIGLANVRALAHRLAGAIDVVGCGGVETGRDALEYVACGATAVQVGSALVRDGPGCFAAINGQLRDLVALAGVGSVAALRGRLEVCAARPALSLASKL